VNAPMSFGALHLGEAVAAFMANYPDLKIELTLSDRFIDPFEEGVDITIRIAMLQDSSLIARKLAPAYLKLVASPEYIARYGAPETANDLANHRCLSFGHSTVLQKWQLTKNGEQLSVSIGSTLCSNNGDVLRTGSHCWSGHYQATDVPYRTGHQGWAASYCAARRPANRAWRVRTVRSE
jgi:DNA-binding transcriptional LysR family regulator